MRALLLAFVLVAPSTLGMSVSDLACGATICLTGDGGSGCAPYLDKYYSIDGPTKAATKLLRKAFLALCKTKEAPDLSAMEQARQAEITTIKRELENEQ